MLGIWNMLVDFSTFYPSSWVGLLGLFINKTHLENSSSMLQGCGSGVVISSFFQNNKQAPALDVATN
jgi:hypothetical protein